jgi:hypothetical protein
MFTTLPKRRSIMPSIVRWMAQVRDAKPDLLISNSLGVDTVNALTAMKQLGYRPPLTFSLFPAPGPLLGLGADSEGVLSVSIFEPVLLRYLPAPAEAKDVVGLVRGIEVVEGK